MKSKLFLLLIVSYSFTAKSQSTSVINSGLTGPIDVFIDGTIAYVNEFLGGSVSSIDLSSSTPSAQEVITGLFDPTAVLVDNNFLYVSEDNGRIRRWNTTNFNESPEVITTSLNEPIHMVMNGTDLFVAEFGSSARIVKIDLAGGNAVETFTTGLNVPRQMAIVGTSLYVAESGPDRLLRFDLNDTTPTPEIIFTNILSVNGLLSIGNTVYMTEDIDDTGRLLSFDGASVNPIFQVVATGLDGPGGISSYQGDIYLIEQRLNQLSKIENVLNVSDISVENGLDIFPNPSTGIFNINSDNGLLRTITVFDLTGRQLFTSEINSNSYQHNAHLQAGGYVLMLETEKGKAFTKIVIK